MKSYNLRREPYQKSLENLKNENKIAIEKKKLKLAEKKKDLKNQYVENLLKNSDNPPTNYPKELSSYWKLNEWDAISKMLNAKNNTIRGHVNFLTRELGRKGKTLEWFLKMYEAEIG